MTPRALRRMMALAERADVIAIGPGLSQHPSAQRCLRDFLPKVRRPVVVDADALNALSGHAMLARGVKAPLVLTPHPGEMARLVGQSVAAVQRHRRAVALGAARLLQAIVVVKGHRTVVADPAGRAVVNTTGNPGMATGGMGDVLTGVIASLIGQGFDPYEAAVTGVRLHGLAGDLAARELGPVGLLASDVADRLPAAIRRALKSR